MRAGRHARLEESGLRELLGRIAERSRLMAPVKRGRGAFAFEWVKEPGEAELEYARTILPPKRAMYPERETLLAFRRGRRPEVSPVIGDEPYVLFGVHPCDLAGIGMLDWAMGERHEVGDPNYLARRRTATIVGVECLPDEYCFCTSVGTCDTREGADLFLTPVESAWAAEVLTEKGGALLEGGADLREPTGEERAEAEGWSERKRGMVRCGIEADVQELPDLLEGGYESEVWERTAGRCYGCGTCTNVCPTCFCFDVWDSVELGLESGRRGRVYDSCQFAEFAVVAGRHNFRGERGDRVRHRWFRKFAYLLREHGRPFCVGCGRCTQACTAGISLTDVLNSVICEARGSVV